MVEQARRTEGRRAAIASEELLEGLRSAVERVFATMLSTLGVGTRLGDPCLLDGARGHPHDGAITVEARVDIDGPLQGWIALHCTALAAGDLARDLLQLSPEDVLSRAEVEDALGECANMIAGVVKAELLDPHGRFALGVPRLSTRLGGRGRPQGTLAHRVCAGTLNAELWLDRLADGASRAPGDGHA